MDAVSPEDQQEDSSGSDADADAGQTEAGNSAGEDAAPTCAGRSEWHSANCQALSVPPRAEASLRCFQARRQQNSTM